MQFYIKHNFFSEFFSIHIGVGLDNSTSTFLRILETAELFTCNQVKNCLIRYQKSLFKTGRLTVRYSKTLRTKPRCLMLERDFTGLC